MVGMFLGGCLVITTGVASAEYRATTRKSGPPEQTDNFSQAVDLTRFRRGNIEWDTQELVSSGFLAVHKDHLQLLKEIQELQQQVKELKGKLGVLQPSADKTEIKK